MNFIKKIKIIQIKGLGRIRKGKSELANLISKWSKRPILKIEATLRINLRMVVAIILEDRQLNLYN